MIFFFLFFPLNTDHHGATTFFLFSFFKEPERGIFMNKVTFPEAEKPGSMSVLPNSFGYSFGGPRAPRKGCQGPEGTKSGFAGGPAWCGLSPAPTPGPTLGSALTTPGAPTCSPAPGSQSVLLGRAKGKFGIKIPNCGKRKFKS